MNNLDKQYQALLQDILDNGVTKQDRTGTGTISVFGRQIRHNMKDGFPLLTTKKMPFKTIVTELLWFLRGDTNIKFLLDNDTSIWNGDAYKNYLKQFEIDPNNFDAEELVKGHGDQCWGYAKLDHVSPTSKEYKRGQINAYLEGKADKPFFYLTKEEFINKIKTDDEFAKKWGELGPIYGKQWRSWFAPGTNPRKFDFDAAWKKHSEIWSVNYGEECGPSFGSFCDSILINKNIGIAYGYHKQIDQIQNLINDLKTNPDSRRLMVNAWNVGELDQMVLPPCHFGFQVYTRELSLEERENLMDKIYGLTNETRQVPWHIVDINKHNIPTRAISLMWNQRSVDTGLGLGFNIASYGLLLEIIAKEVNMVPDELIGNLGDVHLYLDHIEPIKIQLDRTPFKLPKLFINDEFWNHEYQTIDGWINSMEIGDFQIENYQSHPAIKLPLSN